jgi:hypothetical protein
MVLSSSTRVKRDWCLDSHSGRSISERYELAWANWEYHINVLLKYFDVLGFYSLDHCFLFSH